MSHVKGMLPKRYFLSSRVSTSSRDVVISLFFMRLLRCSAPRNDDFRMIAIWATRPQYLTPLYCSSERSESRTTALAEEPHHIFNSTCYIARPDPRSLLGFYLKRDDLPILYEFCFSMTNIPVNLIDF